MVSVSFPTAGRGEKKLRAYIHLRSSGHPERRISSHDLLPGLCVFRRRFRTFVSHIYIGFMQQLFRKNVAKVEETEAAPDNFSHQIFLCDEKIHRDVSSPNIKSTLV